MRYAVLIRSRIHIMTNRWMIIHRIDTHNANTQASGKSHANCQSFAMAADVTPFVQYSFQHPETEWNQYNPPRCDD